MLFKDRLDAGRQLASQLTQFAEAKDVIVLGLARGGVVVAAEIAHALHVVLDVIIVRKIGAPYNEEFALGALSENDVVILDQKVVAALGVSQEYLKAEVARQKELLDQRLKMYRHARIPVSLQGKTVILVDDGLATGASMQCAIQSVRKGNPGKIIVALPVAAPDSLQKISHEVDEVVCLTSPFSFEAVGAFYAHFPQVSDREVIKCLAIPKHTAYYRRFGEKRGL